MAKRKIFEPKECKKCKKMFVPWNTPQVYCNNPCATHKKKSIAELNAGWLMRDEEAIKKNQRKMRGDFQIRLVPKTQ